MDHIRILALTKRQARAAKYVRKSGNSAAGSLRQLDPGIKQRQRAGLGLFAYAWG